jgi:arylsulfatase A-like enzyme
MKKFLVLLLVLGIAVPVLASASSLGELQAQIQALREQVASLIEQMRARQPSSPAPQRMASADQPYNFVVILTDDQRWDTLKPEFMPKTWDLLVSKGVNFTNAFVTSPFCCPMRTSMLSGGFLSKDTQILDNNLPNGGALKFKDDATLAVAFQAAGYKTGLFGKYLNEYDKKAPYIPPGWTRFVGWSNQKFWYDYKLAQGSSTPTASSQGTISTFTKSDDKYLIYNQRDHALSFINDYGDQPFFLYFAPEAPHEPATAAPGDEKLFSSFVYRDRGYNEADLSDKPAIVRDRASRFKEYIEDSVHRSQLRSLQAVDRSVEAIVEAVRAKGALDRTVFVFASDNGVLWGEHGLKDKYLPYEEVVRVPLAISVPSVAPRTESNLIAVNLDLPATLYALAGLTKPTQGESLVPLLQGQSVPWRSGLYLEGYRYPAPDHRSWATIRMDSWKYTEWGTGERELYNLQNDPYELQSLHLSDLDEHKSVRDRMQRRLSSMKGTSITSDSVPGGRVGVAYNFQMGAWGGRTPYTWSISAGQLPAGLALSRDGIISGTPTVAGTRGFSLKVTDSSQTAYAGGPQSFSQSYAITIRGRNDTGDTTPPVIPIASPVDQAVVSGIVDLKVEASDNVGVTGVQFGFRDGERIGVENSEAPYINPWDTTTVPDGVYTVTAVARDAAGNMTRTQTNLTVKNNPGVVLPAVTIATPSNHAVVSSSITLSASVSGEARIDSVRFYVDGSPVGSEDPAPPYAVSWNTTEVANGSYSLKARVRDAMGREGESLPVSVTVSNGSVDRSPPVISAVAARDSGSSVASITWVTNELADSQVEYGPTTTYGSQTSLGSSKIRSHSVIISGLTSGTAYHYRVKSKDLAGNLAVSDDGTFSTASVLPPTSFSWFNRTWTPALVISGGQGSFGDWQVDRSGISPILNQNTLGSHHYRLVATSANLYRNYEIETLVTPRAGQSFGPCGRLNDNGDGYCFRVRPGGVTVPVISKFTDRVSGPEDLASGSPVSIGSNQAYIMKIRFNEDTISGKIYASGTTESDWQVTAQDATYARGKLGLYSHNSQPRFWRATVRGLTGDSTIISSGAARQMADSLRAIQELLNRLRQTLGY